MALFTNNAPAAGNYMAQALQPAGFADAQRAPGPGGVSRWRNMAEQQGQPPGVDPAWSRIFGSSTPNMLLDQRQAANGVGPAPTEAAGAQTTPATGVAYTPQSAGQTNALMPGSVNGNPDNGFSREQQNGGQSNNEKGSTSNAMSIALQQMPQSAAATAAPQQQPTAPIAPPPVPPNAPPPTAPAPPPDAGNPEQQFVMKSASVEQPASAQSGDTGNGEWSQIREDAALPKGFWASMSKQERRQWLAAAGYTKNAQDQWIPPAPTGGGQPTVDPAYQQAQQNLSDIFQGDMHWVAVGAPKNYGVTIPANANIGLLSQQGTSTGPNPLYIDNPAIVALVDRLQRIGADIGNLSEPGGQVNSAQMLELRRQYDPLRNFLSQYFGIQYDPASQYYAAPGDTPPGDDQTPNQDPDGDGYVGDDGTTQGVQDYERYVNVVKSLRNALGENAPQWLIEFIANASEKDAANARYELSTKTVSDAVDRFENSPFRDQTEQMLQNILKNPDNTPWDTVRNQYVSDQDKLSNQIVQNLSTGAARRGLSTGAVQGIQGQLLSQAANQTARGLGDLEIQKASRERDAQYRAIGAAGDHEQLYGLGGLNARIALANFQRQAPQSALSPFEGWGDSWLGQETLGLQQKLTDYQTDFTTEDMANLLAKIAPSIAAAFGG